MQPILETKWWGWGRSDKTYHLSAPSAWWDFLSSKLGPLTASPPIDSLDRLALPSSRLTDNEVRLLQNIAGDKNVSTHAHDRAIHSLGKSYCDLIRIRQGNIPHPTDAVVYPETEAQIEAILELAPLRRGEWIIIPFGGGTTVVGGVEPPDDARPVITINLRQLNKILRLVKESLREREVLLHLAPHLVQPAPYLIPSYKGRLEEIELQIGMIGYDILAGPKSIAHYQKLSADEVARLEPNLKRTGLRAGFVYYDCLVNDARLTLATLKSAAEHGAAVANYVKCVGLETQGGAITGVHFQDVLGGNQGTIHAQIVVNATGPWTDTIRAFAGENEKMLRPTKGIHLVIRREKLNVHHIVVLPTYDERMIFVVPFGAFTYLGTTDTDCTGALDNVHADTAEVSYLLHNVNEAFENLHLTEDDVISTWAGLRPLVNEEGSPSSVSRDYEIAMNENGLVTIAGGKLTTYRCMAETLLDEVLGRVADRFDHRFAECRTAKVPLHGGDIVDFKKYVAGEMKGLAHRWGLAPHIIERLLHHYGTEYLKILSLGLIKREFLQPLSTHGTVLKGEVIYAVEDEMAMTLEDFMERRTDLMHFDPNCGMNIAEAVAHLMGKLLHWDESERKRQLETYRNAVEKMMAFRHGRLRQATLPKSHSQKLRNAVRPRYADSDLYASR